jgi:hypothetical protein
LRFGRRFFAGFIRFRRFFLINRRGLFFFFFFLFVGVQLSFCENPAVLYYKIFFSFVFLWPSDKCSHTHVCWEQRLSRSACALRVFS